MKRFALFILICSVCFLGGVYAADFGAILKGEYEAEGADDTINSGTVTFSPWLSVPFGQSEFYVSAGVRMKISAGGDSTETIFAPELNRLDFSTRVLRSNNPPSEMLFFRIGRFVWQDSSGFIAKGRFDGAELLYNFGSIRLGVSALYTGFLYKDTADINISPADTKDYSAAFDWADFSGTYFAPRRLMASLYGEFPGFPSGRGQLYAGLMAQFDFSDADEAYHTQYLMLRHVLTYKTFDLEASGAAELTNTEADGIKPAFAFSLEGGWKTPAPITDRLSLGLSWASGDGSATAAFFPVTKEARSFVLQPGLSGMMIIKANYEAKILRSLSAELGGRYFIRNDSTSFTALHLDKDSYPLGLELDAGLHWAPFTDLMFSLNGGVFLPKTGTAWADDAPLLWRINAGLVFSF